MAWYMRALSIRQPYAELILRGEKTIEYRSRPTRLIGQRFYIYAAKKWAGVNGTGRDVSPSQAGRGRGGGSNHSNGDASVDHDDLTRPLAPALKGGGNAPGTLGSFPTGVIVGTATITRCVQNNGHPRKFEWHLTNVQRMRKPRKPKGMPQPVWFNPFS